MSVANTGKNASDGVVAQSYWSQSPSFSTQKSYHELDEKPLREIDVIEQLRGNINRLSDLHGRLSFMMGEIGQLTKSRE